MKRIVSAALAFVMAALFAFAPCQMKAEAASRLTTLKVGRTYNSFDITGDRRNDKFLIREYGSGDYKNDLRIFVNGKVAYRLPKTSDYSNYFYKTTAKLITLSNGKRFLFLYCQGDNYDGPVQAILRYANGRFVRTVDFNALTRRVCGHNRANVVSGSGSTVNVSLYLMSWTVGPSDYSLSYRYSGGKLVQNSSAAKFKGAAYVYGGTIKTYNVNRTIKVYSTSSCGSVAFTLRRGDKIQILSPFRISSRRCVYRVKYGSRYGWIIGQQGYQGESNKMFSNIFYAG